MQIGTNYLPYSKVLKKKKKKQGKAVPIYLSIFNNLTELSSLFLPHTDFCSKKGSKYKLSSG